MRWYSCVDAAVVRAIAHPLDADLPSWPDLTGSTAKDVSQWRSWLQQVWAVDAIATAVKVASPVLARRVGAVCAGRLRQPRQVRRVVTSVMRYLLRMTSRATPFGLFAGVAPIGFGPRLSARWGESHRGRARVDTEWLAAVITDLENCPQLRRRVPVVANNLAFVRADRLVVGCQQQPATRRGNGPAEVSVRHSRAVQTIVRVAQSPIPVADLAGKLAAEFPGTPDVVIEGMLAKLITLGVLITSLRPPMTATEPLAYLLEELATAGVEQLPEVAELTGRLDDIHAELDRYDHAATPAQAREHYARATATMTSISATGPERPLSMDLRLDCAMTLPRAVATEAEHAATALTRLTPHPTGSPAWRDYHVRFLERYGTEAVVPLSELLHPDTGLGFPTGYRDSRLPPPATTGLSGRDAGLLELAQRAAVEQRTEIVLDDAAIHDLAEAEVASAELAPHAELRFRVHAATSQALDRGEFELAVTGVSRAAGTTTGRFLDLFDASDRQRMATAYARLPVASEDAIPAQVSAPPVYPRVENVARSPATRPHLISLGEHRASDGVVIELDDLAVTADARRLSLVSLSRSRPVEPVVFSAVEFTHSAHPLQRFLAEVPTAGAAACAPFSWGAAARLPFLPRIRHRRTILAPATWVLTSRDVPGRGSDWAEWTRRLNDWLRQWRVTDAVYLGDGDRRIRLELSEPAHRQLLRSEVERNGNAKLREASPTTAFGWSDGRAHDIALPLATTHTPSTRHTRRPRPYVPTVDRAHGHLPGVGEWLYAKLYGAAERQTMILTNHLPRLLATWEAPPQWWFLRYRDPEPHLRLRFRLDNNTFADLARHIGTWSADLHRDGLLAGLQLDTYRPETGRFGTGQAMTAAESVFAADSTAALAQLTHDGSAVDDHALLAASLVDLAIALAGSIEDGMHWLIDRLDTTPVPAPSREIREQAIEMANPHDHAAALDIVPGGETIATAWRQRRDALAKYCDALTAREQPSPKAVLGDLLHLHHVRVIGIDPTSERACGHLARAAALSWTNRVRGTQ